MADKEAVLKNPLFAALEKVGHTAEQDVYVWSQGLGFHYYNLLTALNEKVTPEERQKILSDIWKFVAETADPRAREVLGLDKDQDLSRLEELMTGIMNNRDHPAILGMGDSVEEAILNWVRTFALVDFAIYTYMERHIGSKRCMEIYMGLWESFALAELDAVKKELGIERPEDVTMDVIAKLSRIYWESIACPYRVTQHSDTVHEAEIEVCPYWENMKEILGESKARSMTLKCEAPVSVNYYDAILKALGVFDRYSFTMDKFSCCGDDCCRVRFERRN